MLTPLKTTRFGSYNGQSFATTAQTVTYEENKHKASCYWSQTATLASMLNIVKDGLYSEKKNYKMSDILSRFIVYVPNVVTPVRSAVDMYNTGTIRMSVAHPNPSAYRRPKNLIEEIGAKAADIEPTSPEQVDVRNRMIK